MLDKNLKKYRENKGYSKLALSKISNVSSRTIEHIEYGKVSPTLDTLTKLAKALNVTVIDLIK